MSGVGLDLLEVEAVAEALARHGERYLRRVFTPGEQAACGFDPGRLAERFAAKEAVLKALGRSDEPVPWVDIEVELGTDGAWRVRLDGAAARLARARGFSQLELSLTRRRGQVAAVALASAAGGEDPHGTGQVQRRQRRGPEL